MSAHYVLVVVIFSCRCNEPDVALLDLPWFGKIKVPKATCSSWPQAGDSGFRVSARTLAQGRHGFTQ